MRQGTTSEVPPFRQEDLGLQKMRKNPERRPSRAKQAAEKRLLERFHNSHTLAGVVQGGIFLRKMPLESSDFWGTAIVEPL
jgi:hypothetical protein